MQVVGRQKEGKPSKAKVTESESKARPVLAADGRSPSAPTRGLRNARGSEERSQGDTRSGKQSRWFRKPDRGRVWVIPAKRSCETPLPASTTKRKRDCERRESGIEAGHVLRREARQEKDGFERGRISTRGNPRASLKSACEDAPGSTISPMGRRKGRSWQEGGILTHSGQNEGREAGESGRIPGNPGARVP